MSRTTEVNGNVLLSITLWDGNATRGVRARVFNSAGAEVSGSPFTLTHRTGGHYSGTGWNPTVEGQYSVSYEIYTDGTFASVDNRYERDAEIIEVRSLDQDLATLLTRLTNTRAANLDNLDATVSSRQSEASAASRAATNQAEHDATQAAIALVNADTDDIQAKIGTPTGASLSADVASVKSDTSGLRTDYTTLRAGNLDNLDATVSSRAPSATALSTAVWTNGRAANLDNLDATVSSRAPASTALSTVQWTNGRAANLDNLDATVASRATQASVTAIDTKLGTPAGVSVSADIASVKSDSSAIKAKTDQLAFTAGNVNANAQVVSDKTGYSITSGNEDTIADKVWDELRAGHVVAGSFGETVRVTNTGLADSAISAAKIVDAAITNAKLADGAISAAKVQSNTITAAKIDTAAITSSKFAANAIDAAALANDAAVEVAVAVWDRTRAASALGGSFGEALQTTVASRASQTSVDTVDTVVDGIAVQTTAIKVKTDQLVFTGGRVDSVIASSQEDAITDKVWNEPIAGHLTVGTTGKRLNDASAGSSPEAIAAAVWDEPRALHVVVGTFGEAIDTPLSTLATTAQLSVVEIKVDMAEADASLAVAQTAPSSLQNAIWGAARAGQNTAGTFGESNQGVISTARAALIDNLSRLDVVVSTRASSTQAGDILSDTNYLESGLTPARLAALDLLDASISSRASAASIAALPTAAQIKNAVLDEPIAAHLAAGTVGKAISDGVTSAPTAGQIADAVWDEARAGHVAVGSFGEVLDAKVSERATQASLDSIKGGGFSGATDTLEAIRDKINTLPTSAGDATAANQATILASIGTKASQASVTSLSAQVSAVPTNPVLTTDPRLTNLDATVSSRAQEATLTTIKGAGFNAVTDSLEAIRDSVAPTDLSPVLAQLSDIKGAGFATGTDSLAALRPKVDAAKTSADAAASSAATAAATAASRASQASVNTLQTSVNAIPTNPALASDPRLAYLDASVSSRAAAAVLADVFGVGYNPSLHSLKAIADLAAAIPISGGAQQTTLLAVQAVVGTLATAAGLSSLASAVAAIPLNTLLATDVRLNNLDATISSRATEASLTDIKGSGFTSVADSLKAIKDAIDAADLDLTPILAALDQIKGVGFTDTADALKPANDTAKAERATIKADTAALLSSGEPF